MCIRDRHTWALTVAIAVLHAPIKALIDASFFFFDRDQCRFLTAIIKVFFSGSAQWSKPLCFRKRSNNASLFLDALNTATPSCFSCESAQSSKPFALNIFDVRKQTKVLSPYHTGTPRKTTDACGNNTTRYSTTVAFDSSASPRQSERERERAARPHLKTF